MAEKTFAELERMIAETPRRKFGGYLRDLRATVTADSEVPNEAKSLKSGSKQRDRGEIKRGISLRAAAHLVGVSKNTLHDYELNKRYPPAEFIYDYCAAIGRPPDRLLAYWVSCHPNPNINVHKRFGHINRYFKNVRGDYIGHRRRKFISLLHGALQYGAFYSQANYLGEEAAAKVAAATVCILDKILLEHKDPGIEHVKARQEFWGRDYLQELDDILEE